MKSITLTRLNEMKRAGERIVSLTAYDAGFAAILDAAGVDIILVGDSLGMVVQGHDSTLPVTVSDMIYHASLVKRATRRALLVVDMPFMSFATPDQALRNAARLMREGGGQMVKLEGGGWLAETVAGLVERGIPVCAHLGLLPQSVHKLGGYRLQGREPVTADRIKRDADVLQQAGAGLVVLECVPRALATTISAALEIPVIGIGAGPDCDGQVLVLHDVLGITPGKRPRFAKDFMAGSASIQQAIEAYVQAVREGRFPGADHSFD